MNRVVMNNKTTISSIFLVFTLLLLSSLAEDGKPYTLISREQTVCEMQAVGLGSLLADYYNSFDEDTEWDMRIHHDFLAEHLGFAGWIQSGLWKSGGKTPFGQHAPELQKV